MSCGGIHETPCSEVLREVTLLLDGEIGEREKIHTIEHHFEECPPCRAEMEHERRMHQLLHDVLTRSCIEQAPQDLRDRIAVQIQALNHPGLDLITEFRRTEISIQVDDFGQIEHHEITIESTQEFRFPREI